MRRLLMPLLLLPVLGAPALAVAPTQAAVHHAKPAAAVQPSAVRSVLQQTAISIKGRLTSDRDACVSGRDVYLVIRDSSADLPEITYVATTNADGRWDLPVRRYFRRATVRLAALTLGGPRCQIAQSNQITFDPSRTGATVRPSSGARLAGVAITLQGRETPNIHGRITSSRPVCEQSRAVFVFVRAGGSQDMFDNELIAVSRNDGRYRIGEGLGMRHRRGATSDIVAVVPGTNNCRPAQSTLRTYFI